MQYQLLSRKAAPFIRVAIAGMDSAKKASTTLFNSIMIYSITTQTITADGKR